MEEFLAFVTIDVWTMIFTWGNLLILFLLMKKFLFKPVNNILDKRKSEIDEMYKNASENETAAKELKVEYESKLSEAKNEADDIVKSASRKAVLKEEEIIAEANAQASKIVERAKNQAEIEMNNAMNQLREEVSEISVMIASKVLEKDINKNDHKEIIGKFINEIGEMK